MDERQQLERKLSGEMGRCIADYDLIGDGDRIMVCSSGGKDSYVMLSLLERLRRRAPIRFELLAVHLDQGHPQHDAKPLETWLQDNGFAYRILREDTYSIVRQKVADEDTPCMLCSRLRRGILYNAAQDLGCNKIALGHNRDDAIETLLLNLVFSGSLKSMPPKLHSDDRRNVVIRPLLYSAEETIVRFATSMGMPIIPCGFCDRQDDRMRARTKALLSQLEALSPGAKSSIFAALKNVRPSHLLDRKLWRDFEPSDAKLELGLPGDNRQR